MQPDRESPDRESIVRELIRVMRRITRLLKKRTFNSLTKEIRPSSVFVMTQLFRSADEGVPALRVSEIASAMGISVPGATRIVTGLEEDGYVRREMDPDDRRAVLVSLTDAGREALAPARRELESRFHGLIEHLGDERSARLVSLLQEVEDYLAD
tara:strand:+ start:82 stop:546 length:465 start_codon:yes stop_codon:yes gene_type:complete